METIRNRYFQGEFVPVDDRHFIDCSLSHCTLAYAGGHVVLERTQVTSCDHQFSGHAKSTVSYLQVMGLLKAAPVAGYANSTLIH